MSRAPLYRLLACLGLALAACTDGSVIDPPAAKPQFDEVHEADDFHPPGTGAHGTHFRLGHINWRVISGRTVEFEYIVGFRRSYYQQVYGMTINAGGVYNLRLSINYGDGVRQAVPSFTATNVDVANDWFEARAVFTHTYPATGGPYTVESSGCCRLSPYPSRAPWDHRNNADRSARYWTTVNFNSPGSAKTSLPAIVVCPFNGLCTFRVAAVAPANQQITYRFATPSEMAAPNPRPGTNPGGTPATLSNTGDYSWNTAGQAAAPAGWYPVYSTQVVMETRDANNNVTTASMIDFFIQLANVAVNAPPAFVAPTPADGSTYTVGVGQTLTLPVRASDADVGDRVSLGTLGSPAGATFTSGAPANPVAGTFTFTPTLAQAGQSYVVNFTAVDSRNLPAQQRSIVINVPADNTPPVIDVDVTGTQGDNSWYVSDVSIDWTVTDPESPVTTVGCTDVTVNTDTHGFTSSCSATSVGGTSSDAVTVKRDATAPVISYSGASSYTVDQAVSVACSTTDATSGVATTTCANVSGDAYTFPLGANTVSSSTKDNAGNTVAASFTFNVNVTYGSLCALVRRWVTQHGVANSLCVKLNAAEASLARGNTTAQQNQLGAFINEVDAQAGKFVPADKAPILVRLANALM